MVETNSCVIRLYRWCSVEGGVGCMGFTGASISKLFLLNIAIDGGSSFAGVAFL